jgi:predicted DNA-binding transcriptional regulator AlpA
MTDTKRVMRAPEAAAYIGLSESTLAKRRVYGLPPEYLSLGGRAIGYAISDLDSWLESCRRQSTSQQAGRHEAKKKVERNASTKDIA